MRRTKAHWLLFGATVHLAAFLIVGLIVIATVDLLLTGSSSWSLPDVWGQYANFFWDSVSQRRRFPFVLCVIANVLILPAATAVWITAVVLSGRRLTRGDVALRTLMLAIAVSVAFAAAIAVLVATRPFQPTIAGGFGLLWYGFVVVAWNLTFVPAAVVAHRLVDCVIRRWWDTPIRG